jgi:hypothetical protein
VLVDALQALLTTDPGTVGYLGTPSGRSDSTNGVFPTQAPDSPTMPYIVYSQNDGNPLAENMTGTPPLRQARFMFSCYGSTYKSAKKLAMAVKTVMLAALPTTLPSTQGVWLRRESDDKIPIGKGTMFVTDLTFLVIFNETA